jgi:urocanate reductase
MRKNHVFDAREADADVLVVGSGLAGLAAAIEAAEFGKKVIVLEKMSYYGGNSNIAGGGYACWDSKLKLRQKLLLGEDSWQLHKEDTLRGGGYYNLPDLVELLAKDAPSGLDWLVDAGVAFKEVLARIGCHSAYRAYQSAMSGKEIINCVKEQAVQKGVEIFLNTKVTGIIRQKAQGRVIGLDITKDGQESQLYARRAVILASGGFSRDLAMRTEHNPKLDESYNCSNHKGATGEVIRYAKAIGADTLHMEFIQLYPCANPDSGSVDRWAFYAYSGPGFGMIYVNRQGKRFVNELAGRDEVSQIQISSCQKPTWAILNGVIAEALGMTRSEIENGIRLKRTVKADSIPELEKELAMPEGKLMDTVQRRNQALLNGDLDPDFNIEMDKNMHRLEKGPFYAISQWPSIHYTMGGLRIDEQARVLDIWGKPIPGLYAAGEICGGIHGANRIGGNALAECVVFGRIAGKNAAAEPVEDAAK